MTNSIVNIPQPDDYKKPISLKKIKKSITNIKQISNGDLTDFIVIINVSTTGYNKFNCIRPTYTKISDLHTIHIDKQKSNTNYVYVNHQHYFYIEIIIKDDNKCEIVYRKLPDDYNIWYGPYGFHSEKGCNFNKTRSMLDSDSSSESDIEDDAIETFPVGSGDLIKKMDVDLINPYNMTIGLDDSSHIDIEII